MKRKLIVALLALMASCSALFAASDWRFFVDGIDQHPQILIGFLPTYVSGGVGYRGLSLLENDTTEFTLRAGAGYIERRFWNDPKTGKEEKEMNPLTFDVLQVDWGLEFSQGFLDSPAGDKDLITLSVGYEGKYEKFYDSMVAGKKNKDAWGTPQPVQTRAQFFEGASDWTKYYPDLAGNGQYLGTNLYFNFFLDAMEDTLATNDGYTIEFNADWSPYALNAALDGKADFCQFTLEGVGAKTLYQYKTEKMNWFSIVVIDRLRVNWLSGDEVPTYARKAGSLGRQVRGYRNYTYGTEFYIVNNLDLRLTGPDMGVDGLNVRVNLFFDFGYGCGKYFNTDFKGSNFLASTGAQFTISIFDFIDLGYQLAYLIGEGRNYANGDTPLVGSFTFFLDF